MGLSRDFRCGMQRAIPFIYNSFTKPICIISPIRQKLVGGWQAIHRGSGLSVIADLASSQEEHDRPLNYFIHGMQLGIDTTLGPPNQASAPPFFNAGSMLCSVL